MDSGLAATAPVWLEPNHWEQQTTKQPIKKKYDGYQMFIVAHYWTQVENLQMHQALWLHITDVRSFY